MLCTLSIKHVSRRVTCCKRRFSYGGEVFGMPAFYIIPPEFNDISIARTIDYMLCTLSNKNVSRRVTCCKRRSSCGGEVFGMPAVVNLLNTLALSTHEILAIHADIRRLLLDSNSEGLNCLADYTNFYWTVPRTRACRPFPSENH